MTPPELPTRPRKPSSVPKVELTIAELTHDADDLKREVDSIKKALWGTNGNIGMVGRLSKVEDLVADLKKVLLAMLGIVLGLIAGGIYQAIIHAVNSP